MSPTHAADTWVDDDIERVILRADHQVGSVVVQLNRPVGLTSGIELHAAEDQDGGPEPILGLERLVDGNSKER